MSAYDTAMTRAFRLAAVAAALLFVGAGRAGAQAPAGGPAEGIAVHGHWTIEVRNPDGTVAERREFENALTPAGVDLLSDMMTRQRAPGYWAIGVEGTAQSPSPCNGGDCVMVPPGAGVDQRLFYTLQVAGTNGAPGAGATVLNAQFTASRDGTITTVNTILQSCPAATAFNECPQQLMPRTFILIIGVPQQFGGLRTADLPQFQALPNFTRTAVAPIAVTAGQIVQVSVTISFS